MISHLFWVLGHDTARLLNFMKVSLTAVFPGWRTFLQSRLDFLLEARLFVVMGKVGVKLIVF